MLNGDLLKVPFIFNLHYFRCQHPKGGFGGGPGQLPHLAPTYAASNALAIIGTESAYELIDRENLANWLNSLRQPDGSWVMHQGGEVIREVLKKDFHLTSQYFRWTSEERIVLSPWLG